MGDVTDEMLMAFVDGELAPDMRERIEAALQTAPELRERAAMFQATRQPIASAFDPILRYPLSEHAARIRGGVIGKMPSVHAPEDRYRRPAGLFRWLSSVFEPSKTLPAAVMLSVAFLGGLGVGWLMKTSLAPDGSPDAPLIGFRNDGLVALDELDRTLEEVKSGASVLGDTADGQEVAIKPILTFRDNRSRYCREYELTFAATRRYGGIACRSDGEGWNVLVHTPITAPPVSSNGTTVASGGGSNALDAVVDRMIEGDALQPEREAALLKSGWRRED